MEGRKEALIRALVLSVLRPGGRDGEPPPPLSPAGWEAATGFAETVHSALPFLSAVSKAPWFGELPEGVRLLVEERLHRERLWMALLDHETDRSVETLLQARIPVIVLKGADLSRRFYPDRALRPMADVDLLVPQGKFSDALEILGRGGYRMAGPFPEGRFRVELSRKDGLPQVELHSRLLAGDSESDTQALWDRSREGQLPGLPRAARVLDSSDLFTYLVRHSAVQHLMESPVWLNDLHHLLAGEGSRIDWERAAAELSRRRAVSAGYFSARMLESWAGSGAPESFTSTLLRRLSPLRRAALGRMARPEEWFRPAKKGYPWVARSRFWLRDGAWDAIRYGWGRVTAGA